MPLGSDLSIAPHTAYLYDLELAIFRAGTRMRGSTGAHSLRWHLNSSGIWCWHIPESECLLAFQSLSKLKASCQICTALSTYIFVFSSVKLGYEIKNQCPFQPTFLFYFILQEASELVGMKPFLSLVQCHAFMTAKFF